MIGRFVAKTRKGLKRFFSFARKLPQKKTVKDEELAARQAAETAFPLGEKQNTGGKTPVADISFPPPSVVDPIDDVHETKKKPVRKKWQISDFQVEPLPGRTRFQDIDLPRNIMHAIADLGFQYCTPIQAESLPLLLKGRDLIGHANTGTGKSAVFLLTLLVHLQQKSELQYRGVKALILAPTRELVVQIAKDGKKLAKYSRLTIAPIYGGADFAEQQRMLDEQRCDIVVATPGRLLDFYERGSLDLNGCRSLVIDEADRMLDMGFIPDVRRIIHHLPNRDVRHTLMFSATITEDVRRLASQWCTNPEFISIEPEHVAVDTVQQLVYLVTGDEKYTVLYNVLKKNSSGRVAVFANQKNEARKLSERLQRNGIECVLLSGDVPQAKRMSRLERFRSGQTRVLVATDVAGRGIHIEGITHVINYSLPYEPEDYVHRIGRTGRAGAEGTSIAFACEEGGFVLPDIEEFIGRKLECIVPEDDLLVPPPKGDVQKKTGRTDGENPVRTSQRSGRSRSGRRKKRSSGNGENSLTEKGSNQGQV